MPLQKVTAQEIVKKSMHVFWANGYNNTSMADIAKCCGLQKGSLYHHFSSKEVLMQAVLEFLHQGYRKGLFNIAYNDDFSVSQKAQMFRVFCNKTFDTTSDGCLMGNIALETAGTNENFAQQFRLFFQDWMDAIEHVLKSIYPASKAKKYAMDTVAQVEGAVMMMKVFDDRSFLDRALDNLEETILNNNKNLKTF